MTTLEQTDIKRGPNIFFRSLLWHLGKQKREINTYMFSTYESNSITVTFLIMGNFKEAEARAGLLFCGLATFKLPTNVCDFVYKNAYNTHE